MPSFAPIDVAAFERDGFISIASLAEPAVCTQLAAIFEHLGKSGGIRHLIDHPAVLEFLRNPVIAQLVIPILGKNAFAYKATLFDKHADANWLVAWHQDISIPVTTKREISGWKSWSVKEGIFYVQPPEQLLSQLLALRLHLDDCTRDNGPLRVLIGSHASGRIREAGIATETAHYDERVITGRAGSALLMRPLLIHASSKATSISRRRVLHLEFAAVNLPQGLNWHRRVALTSRTT